jgi:hypothetical protein
MLVLLVLGIGSIAFGTRLAYEGYELRNVVEGCLSKLKCPYPLDPVSLQEFLANARATLDFGLALVGVGAISLVYAFFSLRKRSQSN